MRRVLILLSVSFISVLLTCSKSSQNPSWSEDKLDTTAAYAKEIGSAAVLVLDDGEVVFSFGDITHKYMCHSIRKPFLGALYGIYVGKGVIDIDSDHGGAEHRRHPTVAHPYGETGYDP